MADRPISARPDEPEPEGAGEVIGVAEAFIASPDTLLVRALADAQAAFPPINRAHVAEVRGKDGKPGYSYTYADLADVLSAVRPVLAANGLAVTQRTLERGKLLVTELRHVAGATIVSEVELGQSPGSPQQFGGALTYLRRYELVTLLGIAAEEDRDAQDVEPVGRQASRPADLPAWALEANPRRKAELLDGLTVLLDGDRDAAKGIGKAVTGNIGHVPDVVVGVINGILATRQAKIDAARKAQDAAAEAPDEDPELANAPADAGVPLDEPAPAAGAGGLPPTDEELARAAAYQAEQAGEDRTTPSSEEAEVVDAELERDLADAEAAGPAPGTVPAPPRTGDLETDVANLRDVGCICDGPLAPLDVASAHDDACPVHGLPF